MNRQTSADEHTLEPDAPPPPLLLTIQQAADLLQIGRCTMQELVLTGAIRSFKIGRLRRIPPGALDDFVYRNLASEGSAA